MKEDKRKEIVYGLQTAVHTPPKTGRRPCPIGIRT